MLSCVVAKHTVRTSDYITQLFLTRLTQLCILFCTTELHYRISFDFSVSIPAAMVSCLSYRFCFWKNYVLTYVSEILSVRRKSYHKTRETLASICVAGGLLNLSVLSMYHAGGNCRTHDLFGGA